MDIQKYNQSLKWLSIIALLPIVVAVPFIIWSEQTSNDTLLPFVMLVTHLIFWSSWFVWVLCFFFSKRIAWKVSHLASFMPLAILVILTAIQIVVAVSVDSLRYWINREISAWTFLVVYIILHVYFYFKAQESQKMHYIFWSALNAPIYFFVFILIGFFSL